MADKPTYEELEQRVHDLEQAEIEHRQVENELRISEKLLRNVMDIVPAFICAKDLDGRFILANKKLTDFYGTTVEEMTGMLHADICENGEELQGMLAADCKVIYSEKPKYIPEETMMHPDGSIRVLETHKIPFSVYDDPAVLIVSADITERKQAEEALREREERLRTIFEAAKNVSFIITDAQDPEPIVLEFSQGAEKIFGYNKTEMVGNPVSVLHLPKDAEKFPDVHKKMREGKTGFSGETILVRKSGEKFPALFSTYPLLDENGEMYAALGVAVDMSEQKGLEAQLRQARKMEAIGTLAGGVAHDFNNLLMAIQGRTSMLLMGKDSSHPDFEHLRGIESYIGSAAGLTRQLLGFARGGKYEVRTVDLNSLLRESSTMFMRTKKEIAVTARFQECVWPVEADRGQIDQVLINLFVNAWQAMPGGGDLYLETENVTLDEKYVEPFSVEPGRYVKISITDTGVGMDKTTKERIFDPFFTTKEMGRGTGLGLASAYGIIENHGGFINVYSEKGEGAKFNVYLPVSEKEVIEVEMQTGNTIRGSETILFVDDEDMVTEIAEEMFESVGYKVLIASSGQEAIRIYEQNKELIDVVILDMIMPGMSGGETYDRMKHMNPKVRVLLSSGYSIDGQATEILGRGCNGFIQKPFKIKELSQKLREILDER